jgi:hypothetical protein
VKNRRSDRHRSGLRLDPYFSEERFSERGGAKARLRAANCRSESKAGYAGLYPMNECGAEFAAFMRKEYENWGRVIREANIKVE